MMLKFNFYPLSFQLAKTFKISRGEKTHAHVVVLEISFFCGDNEYCGWSEAVPYGRYGESTESVINQLTQITEKLNTVHESLEVAALYVENTLLQELIPSLSTGSARNLLDCACWDLLAKLRHRNVAELIGYELPEKVVSAQTLSVDSIEIMKQSASELAHLPLLKVKLDTHHIVEKMQAIAKACPNSKFIVDANEAWDIGILDLVLPSLKQCNVVLIEQPLPADADDALISYQSCIPLCADESCHSSKDVQNLARKYQALNIKLDKTGGLSEAIALLQAAKSHNMLVMLGCMVASSLAMAPIFLLAEQADFVDLDGPVLVAKDRENGFQFDHAWMSLAKKHLWGNAE